MLRWEEQWGGSWRGFDERGWLAAGVQWYNDPDGLARVGTVGRYWRATVANERIPGAWASADEAKAAAQQAHDAAPSGW